MKNAEEGKKKVDRSNTETKTLPDILETFLEDAIRGFSRDQELIERR